MAETTGMYFKLVDSLNKFIFSFRGKFLISLSKLLYMQYLKNYSFSNLIAISLFVVFLLFSVALFLIPSYAVSNLTIISQDSNPFGKPYSNWTADWWKWYIETPFDNTHPSKDLTGANCDRNQAGPVWFISGSERVPIEKTCVIPAGKAILVPILIVECSFVENSNEKTPEGLLECAKSITSDMQGLNIKYDGSNVPEDQIRQKFRISTSPFIVNFPENNVFDAKPAGPSTAVSDGYWIMFKAPPPGNYDIKFGGCYGNPMVVDTSKFCQDVTYHLKILPSQS
jgi:hypothetical protein